MLVNILYSPPPDGDDASSMYASRASDMCTDQDGITLGYVGQLVVNDANDSLPWHLEGNGQISLEEEDQEIISIFLISCSADGSVNRNIRKIMRKLPKVATAGARNSNCSSYYAVAGLGHARCENSANQMADTIFGTARRVDKLLAGSGFFDSGSPSSRSRLETQVELCGPEKEFDPWIKILLQSI